MTARVRTWDGFWTVDDCRRNPRSLFVFGDNLVGKGKKGQAVIRGEPNSVGIPTKKAPRLVASAFFTDDELESNKAAIYLARDRIVELMGSGNYDELVLPADGWGGGLAQLPEKAPQTYKIVLEVYEELAGAS